MSKTNALCKFALTIDFDLQKTFPDGLLLKVTL